MPAWMPETPGETTLNQGAITFVILAWRIRLGSLSVLPNGPGNPIQQQAARLHGKKRSQEDSAIGQARGGLRNQRGQASSLFITAVVGINDGEKNQYEADPFSLKLLEALSPRHWLSDSQTPENQGSAR